MSTIPVRDALPTLTEQTPEWYPISVDRKGCNYRVFMVADTVYHMYGLVDGYTANYCYAM